MDLSLLQPEPAMNGPFMGRPLIEELMPIKRPDMNNGFDNLPMRPGPHIQPIGGGMGIGNFLQQQRPMPTQDIFSGVSGAALGLLAAR